MSGGNVMALYFAYGTDLDNVDWVGPVAKAKDTGQKPPPLAYAILPETALAFRQSSVATNEVLCTLENAVGQCVWGKLINLPDDLLAKVRSANAETHDVVQKVVTVQRISANSTDPAATPLAVGGKTEVVCFVAKADGSAGVLPDGESLRQVLVAALQSALPMSYVRTVAASGVGAGLTVDGIRKNEKDLSEEPVEEIYYKSPPRFAVYGTKKRVRVQDADDPTLADKQRGDMAALNGLRSQISGLIDGWQSSEKRPKKVAKAVRYSARVAAALNLCLEGDGVNAFASLQEVKSDILDERASWGRFQYLICALIASLVYWLVLAGFQRIAESYSDATTNVWRAAAAGAIGAFFSIAIAIRQRTVLTDLRPVDNAADSILRVTIGVIAAAVLCLLLQTNLAPPLTLGGSDGTKITGPKVSWDIVITFGFIAGFLERLVPDMLSKMATSNGNGAPKGK
jgi:hypothetical protein